MYGSLPFTLFATISGWKQVGPRANPYTGKSSEVMSARLAARARRHDRERINLYRNVLIRTVNGKLDNCTTLLEPEPIGVFIDSMANRDAACHASMTECEAASLMSEWPDLKISHPHDCIAAAKGKAAANKFKKRLGAKNVKNFERDAALADGALNPTAATTYRAVSARTNHLAQDRPDGTFSSKELCREFARPNTLSLQKLKRLGRYYAGKPRLVYKYEFAKEPTAEIDVFCDTDFAGCSQTRRSTSGGCALIGGRLIKHWSKTQPTTALSSSEAELVGIGQGMAQALGLQSHARDVSWELKINLHNDATAAIGIAKRRGLGKVRHLHTTDLWIQERVRSGDVNLVKVLGAEKPGDALTKYLDSASMDKALAKMNVEFMEGRAAIAPSAMGIQAVAQPESATSQCDLGLVVQATFRRAARH